MKIHSSSADDRIKFDAPEIYDAICNRFHRFCIDNKISLAPKAVGAPSTTFSHNVFALPHLPGRVKFAGFNTAFRPTDKDKGTHIPAFGQFYLAANDPEFWSLEVVTALIDSTIKSVVCEDFAIEDLTFGNKRYEWDAFSTGYIGHAVEIQITGAQVNGESLSLGRLEVAQFNDFSQSGGLVGRESRLVVIGIHRLLNFLLILRKAYYNLALGHSMALRSDVASMYGLKRYDNRALGNFFDAMHAPPENSGQLTIDIREGFLSLNNLSVDSPDAVENYFYQVQKLSAIIEAAYACNAITFDYRRHYIRQLRKQYRMLAIEIQKHSFNHRRYITSRLMLASDAGVETVYPEISDVYTLPHLAQYFAETPSVSVDKADGHLPCSLARVFICDYLREEYDELTDSQRDLIAFEFFEAKSAGVSNITERKTAKVKPVLNIKLRQFSNMVLSDLGRDLNSFVEQYDRVHTHVGTVAERVERLKKQVDVLEANGVVDSKLGSEVKSLVPYVALEWFYHTPKIFPRYFGMISPIALRAHSPHLQDIASFLQIYHRNNWSSIAEIDDRFKVVMYIGASDEAFNLLMSELYEGNSVSVNDPFSIKRKIKKLRRAASYLDLSAESVMIHLKQHFSTADYFVTRNEAMAYIDRRLRMVKAE